MLKLVAELLLKTPQFLWMLLVAVQVPRSVRLSRYPCSRAAGPISSACEQKTQFLCASTIILCEPTDRQGRSNVELAIFYPRVLLACCKCDKIPHQLSQRAILQARGSPVVYSNSPLP